MRKRRLHDPDGRCCVDLRIRRVLLPGAGVVVGNETVKQIFRLVHAEARRRALEAVRTAQDGYVVEVKEPTRNLDQNARFHAICHDIAKQGAVWMGKPRTAAQWKVLLVSGHAIATNEGAEVVPGIEGEFVNIRESTALMSIRRSSSLIEYAQAYCASNGIVLHDQRVEQAA